MSPRHKGITALALLVATGVVIATLDPADRMRWIAWGERLAHLPATPAVLIVIQFLLFSAAMPGSMMLWFVAPFYDPWQATLILTVGSVTGALGAYAMAARLGGRPPDHPAFSILKRHSDVFTQCALRILPGFPHSVLNYGGGLLRLALRPFTIAALCGLTVKWSIYATAIHQLVDVDEMEDMTEPARFLPLLVLTAFLLLGGWAARRLKRSGLPMVG